MKFSRVCLAALATSCLAAAPFASNAALTLRLSDGATTVQVVDSDGDGFVSYIGAVGSNWLINVSTGLGSGILDAGMDLNTVNVSNAAGTLSIALSEDNLVGGGPSNVLGGIGGTTNGSVSYSLWVSNANDLFGTGQKVFEGSSNTAAFSAAGGSSVDLASLYSMSLFTTITHGSGIKVSSYDFEAKVPEPSSLALVGVGLLGLGARLRRRKA